MVYTSGQGNGTSVPSIYGITQTAQGARINLSNSANYAVTATSASYATTATYASYAGSVGVTNAYSLNAGYANVAGYAMVAGTTSDYRLKTNLEKLQDSESRINQINSYRFNWKNNLDGEKVDGFIAHEISQIVPESVIGEKDGIDADGNPIYQRVDYSKVIPLLAANAKDTNEKIKILENHLSFVRDLEIRTSKLENQILELKK